MDIGHLSHNFFSGYGPVQFSTLLKTIRRIVFEKHIIYLEL